MMMDSFEEEEHEHESGMHDNRSPRKDRMTGADRDTEAKVQFPFKAIRIYHMEIWPQV